MRPWSRKAHSVWGKTDRDTDAWLPLVIHLEDAAGVAGHLWATWVAPIVRARLATDIGSEDAARALYCFLAGIHDVGKASPSFAQLARDVGMGHLVSAMEREGLRSPVLARRDRIHHTLTGHLAAVEWLKERHSFTASRAAALASVVGAHHGTPAENEQQWQGLRRLTGAMGDESWDAVRLEILDTMADMTGATSVLAMLRDRRLAIHSLIDLSALVVMADWIASDESRFPYAFGGQTRKERLSSALDTLDLRSPWLPDPVVDAHSLFHARFPHLAGVSPTPLQTHAVEVATTVEDAPLMLIEAPTGAGKTEAALMSAEVLAGRYGAGGVYVGLPTMATSNAMFGRVLNWVASWPCIHDATTWLAHSKAALNNDFADLRRTSRIKGVYEEDGRACRGSARVSAWLSGRRRGLLANVVVGTIDQVLMGALQTRHLALRHLAMSSKVVVVDEVHSADTYMRAYLVRMLEYLGGYGTPVILLSATLPPSQRAELTGAYQRGHTARTGTQPEGLRERRRSQGGLMSNGRKDVAADAIGAGPEVYPVITTATKTVLARPVQHDSRRLDVRLEMLHDDHGALIDILVAVLQEGGCAAVIRNTVRRAQETYDALQTFFKDDVELYHSRFLAADRANRERSLVERLGPADSERPRRAVIVGTQVLEQSLDIDLDLLVTDVAPIDLILQRVGRLHRHARLLRSRPPTLREPRCLITGVEDWSATVPVAEPASRRIYGEAHLLRSLSVLQPFLQDGLPLKLPHEGPFLVHGAYDPSLAPPDGWEHEWARAEADRLRGDDASRSKANFGLAAHPATQTSLTGWIARPVDDAREQTALAQVRDSEDGIEVIVVQKNADGTLRILPGDFEGAGSVIPIQPLDSDRVTRQLATCTVSLPQSLTNPWRWDATVAELEASPVADLWQQSKWLQGQLVLVLNENGEALLNGHHIKYTSERGLEVTRVESAD